MKTLFLFCLLGAPLVGAERLLPAAMQTFPARTVSLEYDNLKLLRALPNYRDLRRQYASDALQRTQKAMLSLGIGEEALNEVITASGQAGFFGMISGSFQFAVAARAAVENGFVESALPTGPVFCSKDNICFSFSGNDDGRAVFGALAQVTLIANVVTGHEPALSTNAAFAILVKKMDPRTPVFGIAPGSEVGLWVTDTVPHELSSTLNLPGLLANIEIFCYGVRLDSKAHLDLSLLCSSETTSRLVGDTLSAAGSLQRMAAAAGSTAFPFENMVASSSGRTVALKLDAAMPVGR